ncbi:hypothetical protein [Paraburkholderia dipogonis]|uniref:hypothetical protein n=1 Tax=Paraburkholderia dipogonis TaxID=1211383 RepID=UPI0038B7B059
MDKQILMVTGSHDRTCDYLIQRYPNVRFFRLNLDRISTYQIVICEHGFEIIDDDSTITTSTCHSILYRKPIPEDLGGILEPQYHAFAHTEMFSMIEGIVEGFEGVCLSKPSIMRRANNKIVQLQLAERMGLKLPRGLITNTASALTRLGNGKLIVKPLATGVVEYDGRKEFVQTNLLDPSIDTSGLRYVSAYFQEYIKKDYEFRVTIVGNDCHAIRIDSPDKVDWRKPGNNPTYSLEPLPHLLESRAKDFMCALGMQFGCFDFMLKDGVPYFLEMNANGQWAWLDNVAQGQISRSMIHFLTGTHG